MNLTLPPPVGVEQALCLVLVNVKATAAHSSPPTDQCQDVSAPCIQSAVPTVDPFGPQDATAGWSPDFQMSRFGRRLIWTHKV